MTKRTGLILITFEKLEDLLGISHDYAVTDIIVGDTERRRDAFLVKVSGPKMPLAEPGQELMIIPLSEISNKGD